MYRLKFQLAVCLFLAGVLALPAAFANVNRNLAVPGALNYVEGQVALEGQTLDSKSVGSAELQAGRVLTTETGKAEFLLTPGVFVRLGDNTSVKMISPGLTTTEIALIQGEAMVEVDQIYPQNDIRIEQKGGTTQLLKVGLYDFDASRNFVRVFDGKAQVTTNDRRVTVKGGHEVALNTDNSEFKSHKFDKKDYATTDLYRWSSLRSNYLAEANVDAARTYIVDGWYGPGWIGAGWYWDPWFSAYTFVPGGGIFYNPFGWGFYSPLSVYRSPLFYRGGYYYRHFNSEPVRIAHVPGPFHSRAVHPSSGFVGGRAATPSMGRSMGSFGSSGFHGGGFQGGGFHGGGFGGRR
jgi:hypothetical protein